MSIDLMLEHAGELDLDRTSPLYDVLRPLREKSRDLTSGPQVVKAAGEKYLFPLPGERPESYDQRLAMAVYANWPNTVVLGRLSLQWKKPPTRNLPPALKAFENNLDGAGRNANTVFRDVNEDASIDGLAWKLVDRPRVPVDFETGEDRTFVSEQDADDAGDRPFVLNFRAQDVLDWLYDERNRLVYAVLVVDETESNGPGLPPKHHKLRLVYFEDEWGLFEAAGTFEDNENNVVAPGGVAWVLRERGPNALGVVPLVPFYGVYVAPGLGLPVTKDILDLTIATYNLSSSRDRGIRNACNPVPYVVSPENPEEVPFGEDLGFWVPSVKSADKQSAPASVGFLEASASGVAECTRTIRDYISQIFEIGTLQAHGKLPTAQVQSANSQKMESRQFSASLASVAEHLQCSEIQLWELLNRATGARAPLLAPGDDETALVAYNSDFDEDRLNREVLDLLRDMAEAGQFSRRDLLAALNASGILPYELDVDQILRNIEEERDQPMSRTPPAFRPPVPVLADGDGPDDPEEIAG